MLSDFPNREGLRDDGGAASVGERISFHRQYQRLDILGRSWSGYGPYLCTVRFRLVEVRMGEKTSVERCHCPFLE